KSAGTMHYKRSSPAEKRKYCVFSPSVVVMQRSAGAMKYYVVLSIAVLLRRGS
ncbi:hypothetical protein NDU88_010901, partial [Pleurodeles waltl]